MVPALVAFGLELGKFQAGRSRSRFEMFGKGLNNFIEFDSRQDTWATLHNAAQKPLYNTLYDELCEVKNPSHVTEFPWTQPRIQNYENVPRTQKPRNSRAPWRGRGREQ